MNTDSAYTVRARLPLQLRKLNAKERQEILQSPAAGPIVDLKRASRRGEKMDSLDDLISRVTSLEDKIDSLIELMLRKEQQEARRSASLLELRMDGVSFRWTEVLEVGKYYEFELVFGLLPPTEIRCVIVVDSCEEIEDMDGQFEIKASFDQLGEAELDEIHRFMLTAQRRSRRSKTTGVSSPK